MKYLFLLLAAITSCAPLEDSDDGCPEMNMCTEIYKSIGLTIKDKDGKPYPLDTFVTTKLSTGEIVPISSVFNNDRILQTGVYPVFEDGNMPLTNREGQEFEFTGSRDGKVVIRKTFTIGHDCCHIELRKGETSVVIDL
jgi:hypothetical protein